MKPTLLLFLASIWTQSQLCQGRPYEADCNDHAGFFYGKESVNRNAFRTDTCSYATGKMEIAYCRLPGDNTNITSTAIGATLKCEAYGRNGILVTRREYFELPPPSILVTKDRKQVCLQREKEFQPNQTWIEGNFIRRCNPDTLDIEYIGCRSKDNIFVPLGSNKTVENHVDNVGRVVTMINCQSRDAHHGPGYEYTEKIYILPENDFDGCVKVWNNEEVLLKVGEERVVDGVVHVCERDAIYRTRAVGCVTEFANFIKVGENVTERPDLTKGKPSYNSLCLATQDGVKLEIEIDFSPSESIAMYTYLNTPTCEIFDGIKLLNKQIYRHRDNVLACNIDHRGHITLNMTGCLSEEDRLNSNVETFEICNRTSNGNFLESNEPDETTPKTPKSTVGCIGHTGLVPIGESAHVNGINRRCTLIKDGKAEWRIYQESDIYRPR